MPEGNQLFIKPNLSQQELTYNGQTIVLNNNADMAQMQAPITLDINDANLRPDSYYAFQNQMLSSMTGMPGLDIKESKVKLYTQDPDWSHDFMQRNTGLNDFERTNLNRLYGAGLLYNGAANFVHSESLLSLHAGRSGIRGFSYGGPFRHKLQKFVPGSKIYTSMQRKSSEFALRQGQRVAGTRLAQGSASLAQGGRRLVSQKIINPSLRLASKAGQSRIGQAAATRMVTRGTVAAGRLGVGAARTGLMVVGMSTPASAVVTVLIIVGTEIVAAYVVPKVKEAVDDSGYIMDPIKGSLNDKFEIEAKSNGNKTIGLTSTLYQDNWGKGEGHSTMISLDTQGNLQIMKTGKILGEKTIRLWDIEEKREIHNEARKEFRRKQGYSNAYDFEITAELDGKKKKLEIKKEEDGKLNLQYQLVAMGELINMMTVEDKKVQEAAIKTATQHLRSNSQKSEDIEFFSEQGYEHLSSSSTYFALYQQAFDEIIANNNLNRYKLEKAPKYVREFKAELDRLELYLETKDKAYGSTSTAYWQDILLRSAHAKHGSNTPFSLEFNLGNEEASKFNPQATMDKVLEEVISNFHTANIQRRMAFEQSYVKVYLPMLETMPAKDAFKYFQSFAADVYDIKIDETALNSKGTIDSHGIRRILEKDAAKTTKQYQEFKLADVYAAHLRNLNLEKQASIISKILHLNDKIEDNDENAFSKYVIEKLLDATRSDPAHLRLFLLKSAEDISTEDKLTLYNSKGMPDSSFTNPIKEIAYELSYGGKAKADVEALREEFGIAKDSSNEEIRALIAYTLQDIFSEVSLKENNMPPMFNTGIFQ